MFGKYFKHVLVLTALAWITYTMPSVRAALESSYVPDSSYAAVSAAKIDFASTSLTSSKAQITRSAARAEVVGTPRLSLTYGTNKKEAALKATFIMRISGGAKGVFVDTNQLISFVRDASDGQSSEVTKVAQMIPTNSNLGIHTGKATEAYYIPANKTVLFSISSSVDPQILFAGSYSASIRVIYAYVSVDPVDGYKIVLPDNKSNSKVIVGETSPYIYAVNTNVKVGDTMVVSGVRFNDGTKSIPSVYVDGAKVSKVSSANDGTTLSFVLGSMLDGSHTLYVVNKNGKSNVVSFVVGKLVVPSNIVVMNPVAGESVPVGQTYTINWGGGWDGNDSFALVEYHDYINGGFNSKSSIASGLTQDQAGCPGIGKGVCSYAWKPMNVGMSKISVIKESSSSETDRADSGIFSVASSTLSCFTFTRNLEIGSEGSDVVALQTLLRNLGYWPVGSTEVDATGYFGSITASALMKYQTAKVLPATGFVGPLTRAALNAECSNPPVVFCPDGYTCTGIPQVTLVGSGIQVTNTSDGTGHDTGLATIKFKIYSPLNDIRIDTNSALAYATVLSSGVKVGSPSSAVLQAVYADLDPDGYVTIEEGQTVEFALTAVITPSTSGQYKVVADYVNYSNSGGKGTITLGDQFSTSYVFLR